MKRREFLQLALFSTSAALMPKYLEVSSLDLSKIDFSSAVYSSNEAQSIIIFLAGGASQLAGNLTNLDEIEQHSQNSYKSYFRGITPTANGFWQEAGGVHLEKMLSDGDMTLFRTCYSAIREANNNKAHGVCTEQNQKGNFDTSKAGIITNLAKILAANGVIDANSKLPFITMLGENKFYAQDDTPVQNYLKPIGLDRNFNNPYERSLWSERTWIYYTDSERSVENHSKSDKEGGFVPQFSIDMDVLAQKHNSPGKIKDAFAKRKELSDFINSLKSATVPDLGEDAYPQNNHFAQNLKAAITILDKNPDTKVITIGNSGLGGWDDHNEARDYVSRAEGLFRSIRSALAHLKAINKDGKINIIVFSEFGRNVNLNSAFGWDHGNLQNLYIFAGKDYFNHKGVVGETRVDVTGKLNRLWLKPKNGSYWFEPMAIAATIYKIYGIENPQVLTGGYDAVDIF